MEAILGKREGAEKRYMKTVDQVLQELKNEPPSNDVIKDLLPDSTTAYMALCGRAGIGKTNLTLQLAFCIATGNKFLNLETKQQVVGYLSFEGARHQIAKRFEKLIKSFGEVGEYLRWEHSLPIKLNRQSINKFKEILTGIDVAIIDPLRPLVAGDAMKPADASTFLDRLREVQNDTGTTIILLHHIRKPDRKTRILPEDLQFEIKGPTEYVDGQLPFFSLTVLVTLRIVWEGFRVLLTKGFYTSPRSRTHQQSSGL
jgi:hypothetical protein